MKFKAIKRFWQENQSIVKYILFLFIATRLSLTAVGSFSKYYFQKENPNSFVWSFTDVKVLDIWGVWDSGYYLDIAKRGYSYNQDFQYPVKIEDNNYGKKQLNFHFFPLYPILVKLLSVVFDYYYSALVISNTALLLACFFLYKFLKANFGEQTGKRAVKYLLFFPTSFIYSGVFTESTALLFIILAFYFSGLKKPIAGGVSAALAFLTKTSGFLSMIALIPRGTKSFLSFKFYLSLFIPVGAFLMFLLYHYVVNNNALVYFETAANGWGVKFVNPVQMLATLILANPHPSFLLYKYTTLAFAFSQILMLVFFYKKLPLKLWFFWLFSLILPLSSGAAASISIPRHVLLAFPQYLALAIAAENKQVGFLLSLVLLSFQLVLMALWVNGAGVI